MHNQEEIAKTETKLAQTVQGYERELVSVKRAADKAQGMPLQNSSCIRAQSLFCCAEDQRRASRNNVALSEESLEEYQQLWVSVID